MKLISSRLTCLILLICLCMTAAEAELYTVTVTSPKPPIAEGFNMGMAKNPDGSTITVDSYSLRLNGRPWTPVMGEFHYSRYPVDEWRNELLKMKAGGIDIVATYVFWIHHEEIEGEFDFTERRNLRKFIETAGQIGLKAIVRCGPWCHGEVRNGGLPDWILEKDWRVRSDDPDYLAKAGILYEQISKQLTGLLWKDGGPVIGIQLENEYGGSPSHLLSLKRIARHDGLDVPLYTRTGWPRMREPMPFGEILPLFGVYAEGFWDRRITPMPGDYRLGFYFTPLRTDSAIATDQLGERIARDEADVARYPYLTCEIGGGMMNSYHRRILIYPADVESTTLVKLGSGSTSPGYYMYHGGVNPEGKLSRLMESQATPITNWNDMPVKNYDFQAPLGHYGQIRPHYHLLRRLHLFLRQWGPVLAGMPTFMPDKRPAGRDDVTTLRWAVRSDGDSGLVFVNNYERLGTLPAKEDVQFSLNLPSGSLKFPTEPVTIPADARFFWPFNFDLGYGVMLTWATAQPVCVIEDNNVRTVFFAETPGIKPQFAIGEQIYSVKSSRALALKLSGTDNGSVQIIVLDEKDSLAVWKGFWLGRQRVFLTRAGLVIDGDELKLTSSEPEELKVSMYPAPAQVATGSKKLNKKSKGLFEEFVFETPRKVLLEAKFEKIKSAGPVRAIPLGQIDQPVAAAPLDADFEHAAVWEIKLPANIDLSLDPVLRLHYVGDVARLILNDKFITDDFYNGRPFDIGLRRHASEILNGRLQVAILPLQKDAPIYMAQEARPDFGEAGSIVELRSVELMPHYQIVFTASKKTSR